MDSTWEIYLLTVVDNEGGGYPSSGNILKYRGDISRASLLTEVDDGLVSQLLQSEVKIRIRTYSFLSGGSEAAEEEGRGGVGPS